MSHRFVVLGVGVLVSLGVLILSDSHRGLSKIRREDRQEREEQRERWGRQRMITVKPTGHRPTVTIREGTGGVVTPMQTHAAADSNESPAQHHTTTTSNESKGAATPPMMLVETYVPPVQMYIVERRYIPARDSTK